LQDASFHELSVQISTSITLFHQDRDKNKVNSVEMLCKISKASIMTRKQDIPSAGQNFELPYGISMNTQFKTITLASRSTRHLIEVPQGHLAFKQDTGKPCSPFSFSQ